ncbi:antibiotic biosynthesis monooxygenase family protein [Limibacter armeniacum]|uniref:putative quinol monooxygenase n=1 Tax=Limibacter armeniacum TaxID=466084 RepID=UPI002FE552E9
MSDKKLTFEETLTWMKTTDYSGAIGVTARFRVADEYVDEFVALLKDYSPYVLEEEGCLDYSFHRDWQNPNDFWLTEKWASPTILLQHLGPNARKGTKYEGSIPLDKFAAMNIFPDPAAIYKVGL